MLKEDRIYISQFIYLYREYFLLCHEVLQIKPCYNLLNKMSWNDDVNIFTNKLFLLQLRLIKQKIPNFKNEAK